MLRKTDAGYVIDPERPIIRWRSPTIKRSIYQAGQWSVSAHGFVEGPNGTVLVHRMAYFTESELRALWTRIVLRYPTDTIKDLEFRLALAVAAVMSPEEGLETVGVADRVLKRYPLPDEAIGLEGFSDVGVSVPDLVSRP